MHDNYSIILSFPEKKVTESKEQFINHKARLFMQILTFLKLFTSSVR
jgi:hypothetical protein